MTNSQLAQKVIEIMSRPGFFKKVAEPTKADSADRWHIQLTQDYLRFWREFATETTVPRISQDKDGEFAAHITGASNLYVGELCLREVMKQLSDEELVLLKATIGR